MSNAINYIGIARKAGSIEMGETNSGAAIRGGKGKLLILASDASDNAKSRAENYISGKKTPLVISPFTKEQLSEATGTAGCSMAAFTDVGLAAVFMSALAEDEPSYAEAAAHLSIRNTKTQLRKKEAVAHDRNKKIGKAANTAVSGNRRKTK